MQVVWLQVEVIMLPIWADKIIANPGSVVGSIGCYYARC